MFGRNFDKLKTNSALEAVYRVKHHRKWLKIKCRSPELRGLSCRNNIPANTRQWSNVVLMLPRRLRRRPNIKTILGQCLVLAGIVTACCSSNGRAAGVYPAFASSVHAAQGRRVARDCPAPSTGRYVIQSKRIWRWYNVVLARLTCCWRSSSQCIYAFICVQYFKHTQLPLTITQRTKICVAFVQRPPRTSNECWRTSDARKTLWQKIINFQCVGRASTIVWLSPTVRKKTKTCWHWARIIITAIQRVPSTCPANI